MPLLMSSRKFRLQERHYTSQPTPSPYQILLHTEQEDSTACWKLYLLHCNNKWASWICNGE